MATARLALRRLATFAAFLGVLVPPIAASGQGVAPKLEPFEIVPRLGTMLDITSRGDILAGTSCGGTARSPRCNGKARSRRGRAR